MKAIFIGEDGSMGLIRGKVYDIDIKLEGEYIMVHWSDGRGTCPYQSIQSLYNNWATYIKGDNYEY